MIKNGPHGHEGGTTMTIYTATFKSGKQITKTEKDFRNRLAFMNWICENRLGKTYGKLIEITCRIIPD